MDIKILRNNHAFETSRASEKDRQMEHKAYSHRVSVLTLVLTLVLVLERNTLVSVALFTPSDSISTNTSVNIYVSLRLRVQNAVPAQPCVGKLGISLVLLNFLHCNFRLWFKTP